MNLFICVAECLGLCVGNWLSETYGVAANLVNVLLDESIWSRPFSALWARFWATFFLLHSFYQGKMFGMARKTELGSKLSVAELLRWR